MCSLHYLHVNVILKEQRFYSMRVFRSKFYKWTKNWYKYVIPIYLRTRVLESRHGKTLTVSVIWKKTNMIMTFKAAFKSNIIKKKISIEGLNLFLLVLLWEWSQFKNSHWVLGPITLSNCNRSRPWIYQVCTRACHSLWWSRP